MTTASQTPPAALTNSRWCGADPETTQFPLPPPFEQQNLVQLFAENCAERGHRPFARVRDIADNQWLIYSWREAAAHVCSVAKYLREEAGVKKGDRVALYSSNRYEWLISYFAILSAGAVAVPVYHVLRPSGAGSLLWETGAEIVFAENEDQARKLTQVEANPIEIAPAPDIAGGSFPHTLRHIVTFEEIPAAVFGERSISWQNLLSRFPVDPAEAPQQLAVAAAPIERGSPASILYTSGTTGHPKGVVHTHGNFLAMADGIIRSGLTGSGEDAFLSLPFAHSYGLTCALAVIARAGSISLPTVVDRKRCRLDSDRLLQDLRCSTPNVFPTVPRLLEKILEQLFNPEPATWQRRMIAWALRRPAVPETPESSILGTLKQRLAAMLLDSARRAVFGPKLRSVLCGSAPLGVAAHEGFRRLGITLLEGYGLTEAGSTVTSNTPEFNRPGTVGRPFDGVEIAIDESDGEILLRGESIAREYWRRPSATAEAWQNGWLRTGDMGRMDEDGYLTLTGRKIDLITLADGTKAFPLAYERRAKQSTYIDHLVLVGEGKAYLGALIVLNKNQLRFFAHRERIERSATFGELTSHPRVQQLVTEQLAVINSGLPDAEQIKRFAILPDDFTMENGMLSLALKVKRQEVLRRYQREMDRLFTSLPRR